MSSIGTENILWTLQIFLQDMLVTCPYADAIELPERVPQHSGPKTMSGMANGGSSDGSGRSYSRQDSAADSESSTASTESTTHSELTKYIAQHYNPGTRPWSHGAPAECQCPPLHSRTFSVGMRPRQLSP